MCYGFYPVVKPARLEEWLDPETDPERARAMFALFPADRMEARLAPAAPRAPERGPAPGADPGQLSLFWCPGPGGPRPGSPAPRGPAAGSTRSGNG